MVTDLPWPLTASDRLRQKIRELAAKDFRYLAEPFDGWARTSTQHGPGVRAAHPCRVCKPLDSQAVGLALLADAVGKLAMDELRIHPPRP